MKKIHPDGMHLENWWLIALLALAFPMCNYSNEVRKASLYSQSQLDSFDGAQLLAGIGTIIAMIILLFIPPIIARKKK